jgi:hypothetical protein
LCSFYLLGSREQYAIELRNYTVSGRASQGIPSFLALVALSAALGYLAWRSLIVPSGRRAEPPLPLVDPARDSLEFFAVAGAAVDLAVIAPDGRRATSGDAIAESGRIPRSEGRLDCPNPASPIEAERVCTASVEIRFPASGTYRIIASARDARYETLNVGWGTHVARRGGAFDVPVQVTPAQPAEFAVIVARDGVSQRTVPRAPAR